MKRYVSLVLISAFISISFAQRPTKQNSSEIYESLRKLNFLGSVLYVAAHPDDENTRLISYFSNHVKARTAYLSMTRGDGGQNLIGPELRELLGVIRTQELLAARRIDGGAQFFTRANDFGYSKHPDETLALWNKDEVLKDVVSVIRKFKPDIIINRFDHKSAGRTHGHHTSSAMLSIEAFDLANNEKFESHYGELWQPKRLFFNTHWWFYGSREKFEETDKSKMLKFDTGVYYPSIGLSNNEVASIASSQHLCQGFGRLTTRGSEDEYIEFLKGDQPSSQNNAFEGIDTSWTRIKDGQAIGKILIDVEKNFNFRNPSVHVPQFLEAYRLIEQLEDAHWKEIKRKEIKEIIAASLGLYVEVSASNNYANPGGKTEIHIEALNRSDKDVTLISASYNGNSFSMNQPLTNNKKYTSKQTITIDPNKGLTAPYWLLEKGSLGMYKVKNTSIIGAPETPPLNMKFLMEVNGAQMVINKPIVRRFSKPDKGELYEPFQIVSKVTTSIAEKVIIFADSKPKEVVVRIRANAENVTGKISLNHPEGWKVSPAFFPVKSLQKGSETSVTFRVTPSTSQSEGKLMPVVNIAGKEYDRELIEINYDHIPKQSVLLPSEAKVVRLNIEKKGQRVAYIQG
ncbi:MAG: PIG-L family deacetylase, partial [Flavobacteriaceae bacterium]|nr:PIG-L family deacetylase [Flavobacteriaceae bacterium]